MNDQSSFTNKLSGPSRGAARRYHGAHNSWYPLKPFCETDLPLQQLVQETQLSANVIKADLNQRIVVGFELLVGLPVHAFGFETVSIKDASRPAHAFAQLVGFGGCPVARTFFLRGVTQPATVAASKVPARRVEHRHALAAPWAGEPVALPAQVARRGLRLHPLLDQFVGTLHAVRQHHALQI